MIMNNGLPVIERAPLEIAAAPLDDLKIIGGKTENLSFGAEGVPLSFKEARSYRMKNTIFRSCVRFHTFLINGEYADFAPMNLELNTVGTEL